MSSTLIDPKKHRQLFLDDYAVEKKIGVKQTLHPPQKVGPVIRPDQSLGETAIQSRSVPQWNPDKGIWEWWYSGKYVTTQHPLMEKTGKRPPWGCMNVTGLKTII